MSPRRMLLAALLVILILPILIIGFMIARLDPNRLAPTMIAAVDQATGRQLTLSGPIKVKLSLTPEIDVNGISLTNPPGFPDPDLVTLDQVEAKIALVPLFSRHIDILQLLLVHPVIRLEHGPNHAANWDFAAGVQPNAAAGAPNPGAPNQASGYKLALASVKIENGVILIGASRENRPITLAIPALTGMADTIASPLQLDAQAVLGGAHFCIAGTVGPVARFSSRGDASWPIDLTLQLGRATASVIGAMDHPRTGKGYDLQINVAVPALEAVAGALPAGMTGDYKLPPLHDVTLAMRVADQGSAMPAIDNLSIKAGPSDLSDLRTGLSLDHLDVEMASLDAPLLIAASGHDPSGPISIVAKLGAPAALFNPARLPPGSQPEGSFPITLTAQLGAGQVDVNGEIATPAALAGVALAVSAAVPDLSALSPLLGQKLPAWKNIRLQATLIDPGGLGLRAAVGIDGLAVTMDDAAFGGDASLYLTEPRRLQLALNFSEVNLDALLAEMPQPAAPVASSAPPPNAIGHPMIPDWPLPLKMLKAASADIQLSADTLIWNQATYTALQGHAVLGGGVLTLSPVTGLLPGGSITAVAKLDAAQEPALETLNIHAPALALSPFLRAFGLSDTAEGTAEAQLNATSTGDDLPAIAAGLDGQFGFAMVNGIVDGSVLDQLFGTVLHTVGLPERLIAGQGPVSVRCMALRVDSEHGVGTFRALTLDSSRLLVQGGGSIDFGTETLNMILRPQLDFAGTEVGVPVQLSGSFSAPTTSVAPASAVQAAAQAAIGLPLSIAQETFGANTVFGKAASMLGAEQAEDVCPAALSLARLGQPGPAAPPETAPGASRPAQGKLSGPRNLLDTLFGK